MAKYTQANRPLAVTTPLGTDVLLLEGFRGLTSISTLFRFELDLLALRDADIPFEKLLGQSVDVRLTSGDGPSQTFNGIISNLKRVHRDKLFTRFHAEMVPRFWLSTRSVQGRVFQQKSVPDILADVLKELRPNLSINLKGSYLPRDYCVQYRESDFDFASRLMEEEGIYYYFQHSAGKHVLVVTDNQSTLLELPQKNTLLFKEEGEGRANDLHVSEWQKEQGIRSGRCTMWDHCFELPGRQGAPAAPAPKGKTAPAMGFQNLEAKQTILESVPVGGVKHQLHLGVSDALEIYEYPGGYAQRFDGVGADGGDRSADLPKIFDDGRRTAKLRMEQEAVQALRIDADSNYGHLTPGCTFKLQGPPADSGTYLITHVEHDARSTGYRSGEAESFTYQNHFGCLPFELPYRSVRRTARPAIGGVQTATVVGPAGQELAVDKYGRVKVQFHWDRQGKYDASSSCWVRVSQSWAGNRYGAFFWPRVGHEVVVAFEEGDPDRPIIVGSVYNAANMPPLALPDAVLVSGFKSCSADSDPLEHFNCVVFHDVPGREYLQVHSENQRSFTSEAAAFTRTSGPAVESFGTLFLPCAVGSGGGGGDIKQPDETPTNYLSYPGLFQAAGFSKPTMVESMLLGSLPSKTTLVCGNVNDMVLQGKRATSIMGNSDIRYVLASPVRFITDPALAAASAPVLASLAILGAVGSRVTVAPDHEGGELDTDSNGIARVAILGLGAALDNLILPWDAVDMVLGQKVEQTYYGPRFDIARCKGYLYHNMKGFFSLTKPDPYSAAAKVFLVLTYLTAWANTLLCKVYNEINEDGTVTSLDVSFVNSNAALEKIHFILMTLETKLAEAATAKVEAEEAARHAELAALYTPWLPTVTATADSATSHLDEAAEQLIAAADTLADVSGKRDPCTPTLPKESQIYDGMYQLSAGKIELVANQSSDIEPGWNRIILDARSAKDPVIIPKGLINLMADKKILIEAEDTRLCLEHNGPFGGTVTITNPSPGDIRFVQGTLPASCSLDLKGLDPADPVFTPAATMTCIKGPVNAEIFVSPLGISLWYKVGGVGPGLILNEKGITMSFTDANVLSITSAGISINGTNIDVKALATLSTQAIKETRTASAQIQQSTPLATE